MKHLKKFKESSCKSKVPFDTIERAWKKAKQFGQRAYPCEFCDKYHISSTAYDYNRAYDEVTK